MYTEKYEFNDDPRNDQNSMNQANQGAYQTPSYSPSTMQNTMQPSDYTKWSNNLSQLPFIPNPYYQGNVNSNYPGGMMGMSTSSMGQMMPCNPMMFTNPMLGQMMPGAAMGSMGQMMTGMNMGPMGQMMTGMTMGSMGQMGQMPGTTMSSMQPQDNMGDEDGASQQVVARPYNMYHHPYYGYNYGYKYPYYPSYYYGHNYNPLPWFLLGTLF